MDGVTLERHLLGAVEAEAVATAGVAATADPGHLQRGREASSVLREDQGAPGNTRLLLHHPKGGSAAHLLMTEAHSTEVLHRQGMVGHPMVQIMKLAERAQRIGVLLKKMAAVAVLAQTLGILEAPLKMTMKTRVLQGAVNEIILNKT